MHLNVNAIVERLYLGSLLNIFFFFFSYFIAGGWVGLRNDGTSLSCPQDDTFFFFKLCGIYLFFLWLAGERERETHAPDSLAFSRTYVYMCSTLEMFLRV